MPQIMETKARGETGGTDRWTRWMPLKQVMHCTSLRPEPGQERTGPSPLPRYSARGVLRQAPAQASDCSTVAPTGAPSREVEMHEAGGVGSDPMGLMLGGKLALARVDVAVVERHSTPKPAAARAGVLQSRPPEAFDQRGIVARSWVRLCWGRA
ncbi:FAD-dependent monooxygenase [Lapillicoccus sp.]|uniref:FAD-dependent monooxygenase n=1 Tax=Lapillicoccus sp. TaxID=1909287 RepID=UPI00387E2672